jgi:hypothetical protein
MVNRRTLDITGSLTAKEDKVVTRITCRIALNFLFVMDQGTQYCMRRERQLALAASGDYRCQGVIV